MRSVKVTKANLVVDLAADLGVTQKDAGRYFEAFVEGIARQLVSGNTVDLAGFGKFEVSDLAARTARNPRTGEAVAVPASKAIRFKSAKAIKDRVNSG
jgi:DNA-binding protein HU-beta